MQRTQVSRLESLPSELFLSITEYAGFDGRLSLSAANSNCRSLLLQSIFRTLRVTSDEEEADEVLKLAKRIGGNVRAIAFHGTAGPNLSEEGKRDEVEDNTHPSPKTPRDSSIPEQVLPAPAAALLSGAHLPNASTLIVHFAFDFENNDLGDGIWDSRDDLSDGSSMYVFTVPETNQAMLAESEAEFPWRRLMSQTWGAASQNKNITSLVVGDLIPKAVTSWFDSQWARFLSQLSDADIQLWGGDNGAGWEVGTLDGYMYFVSQLDRYFLGAMTNVKKLRLSCYEHGPLGSRWTDVEDTMALRVRSGCLPRLEELRLEYAAICPELGEFLVARGETLRKVALHECFASREYRVDEEDVRMTWAELFSALRAARPTYDSFTVTNDAPPPLTFKEWQRSKDGGGGGEGKDADDEEESEGVKSVRAEMARHPEKMLFMYATLTDKYGDRWPELDVIRTHFQAGKDMEEFGKLMRLVGKSGEA
ncbi:hypothetical protein P171DRAFT_432436 [Karstenula rhodostoma CBS 690.94]|uniref:F-box domain-containing protein n=1 Tax=Karstenula rhodostoma CBS 690.94 TaxID=1392251 RepID=A0A9P4PJM4_9PLEO|nr:hypothetical protein P171DRAFT_432436 [Karstenula rhodostoma CBS 690.94]